MRSGGSTCWGGAWSGANLFWFGDPKVSEVLALWRTIEQERKRGRAVIRAFGPLMLAGVGLHLLQLRLHLIDLCIELLNLLFQRCVLALVGFVVVLLTVVALALHEQRSPRPAVAVPSRAEDALGVGGR